MSLKNVNIGDNAPHEINAIIEIAANQLPIKYEIDKHTNVPHVDRFLSTAMQYPCNYGYIPNTLCEDGDPYDVLVITPYPVMAGSVIKIRPIGVMVMTDEAGKDNKMLAVPVSKLTKEYDHIQNPTDISPAFLNKVSHFFEHYKDLESGKWVKIEEWLDREYAINDLAKAIQAYK
jgi:inorganic pyrophosphatase